MRALLILLAILVSGPAQADGISRTQPSHMYGKLPSPLEPGSAPKPSVDKAQPIIVLKSKKPYDKELKFDPVLSAGCRDGNFTMTRPNRFVAQFTGPDKPGVFEVIPKDRRDLLVDRNGYAREDEDYFFQNAGWSNCAVWFKGRLPPRVLKQK